MFKNIKDPIHGYIELEEEDMEILNTNYLERLRYIHHLGTGFLIYPGATHSRFEHSLGVMYLGTRIFESLVKNYPDFWEGLSNEKIKQYRQTLRWACLLHDVGHLPFSHVFEDLFNIEKISTDLKREDFKEIIPYSNEVQDIQVDNIHELLGSYIVIKEYKDKLEDYGVNPKEVAAIILGKIYNTEKVRIKYLNVIKSIVSSPIDVDKLDYLLRDNYMTGAKLVSLDVERILASYCVFRNELHLNDKAISVIMNLINSRELMHLWVYQHHKVSFTEFLLKTMIKRMCKIDDKFEEKYLSVNCILALKDDCDILSEIKNNVDDEVIKHYYGMWINRKYLSSCWKHRFDLRQITDPNLVKKFTSLCENEYTMEDLKRKICEDLSIDTNDLIIAIKKYTPFTPKQAEEICIIINNEPVSLNELDLLHTNEITFGTTPYIYCPKDKKEDLRKWMKEGLEKYITLKIG